MKNKSALLVIDLQYDFIPGGTLAVKEGDQIVPIINELLSRFELVIFTKDWHPEGMEAFASSHKDKNSFDEYVNLKGEKDILWPDHCIQNTPGARIHEGIDFEKIKGDFYIFKKGMEKNNHPYSGFGAKGLKEFLNEKGVEQVFICGLASDFCCKDTAIDGAMFGFDTFFIVDGTRSINSDLSETLINLKKVGVKIIESQELLFKK